MWKIWVSISKKLLHLPHHSSVNIEQLKSKKIIEKIDFVFSYIQ